MPSGICFDHDLGYTVPEDGIMEGHDVETPIGLMDANAIIEKTGMDCAKWLTEYCMDKNLKLPLYGIQSANTCGKDNINGLLLSFIKFQNETNV